MLYLLSLIVANLDYKSEKQNPCLIFCLGKSNNESEIYKMHVKHMRYFYHGYNNQYRAPYIAIIFARYKLYSFYFKKLPLQSV
jgi:hypothetical protein